MCPTHRRLKPLLQNKRPQYHLQQPCAFLVPETEDPKVKDFGSLDKILDAIREYYERLNKQKKAVPAENHCVAARELYANGLEV